MRFINQRYNTLIALCVVLMFFAGLRMVTRTELASQPKVLGDSVSIPPANRASPGAILYFGGFEGQPNWTSTMKPTKIANQDTFAIEHDAKNQNHFLRAIYKNGSYANQLSPAGTSATVIKFSLGAGGLGIGEFDQLYLQYSVRFQKEFDFAKSGKLPGLAGGTNNAAGNIPTGSDGWSGRLTWLAQGKVANYLYIPGIKKFGKELLWINNNSPASLQLGRWECINLYYKMNSPEKADGIVRSWLNDTLVVNQEDIVFRTTGNLKIDTVMFDTFFGGSTQDYASPKTQYADFDNLILSTEYIQCPHSS